MSPGSVQRPGRSPGLKRLVRYYVSQRAIRHGYRDCPIKTMNASHLDEVVRALALGYLDSCSLGQVAQQGSEVRDYWIREILDGVVLSTARIEVRLDLAKISELREMQWSEAPTPDSAPVPVCPYKPRIERRGRHILLTLSIQIKRL